MADHVYLWDQAEEITVSPALAPYTRVVLNVDEDIWYESPQQLRGGGVVSVRTQLSVNDDSENAPAENAAGWVNFVERPQTQPADLFNKHRCLWARTVSTLAEQTPQGKAVDVKVQYAPGDSCPAPESDLWQNAPPSGDEGNRRRDGQRLWGRTLYTLSTGEVVLGDSWLADDVSPRLSAEFFSETDGFEAVLTTEYYLSTSAASLEGGYWNEIKPAFQNGRYYFVRCRIWARWPGSSLSPVYRGPVAAALMTEKIGEPYLAIDKVEPPQAGETDYSQDRAGVHEEFYLSTEKDGQKDGDWSGTYPIYEKGLYFWTRLRLEWTSSKADTEGGGVIVEEEADTYTYPTAAPIPLSAMELRDTEEGVQTIQVQYNTSGSSTVPPAEGDIGWLGSMSWSGRPYAWGRLVSYFAMQTPKGRVTGIEVQYAASESRQTPPLPTAEEWRYTGVTLTPEKPYPWGRVTGILSTGERVTGTPWLADPDGRYGLPTTEYQLATYYYLSSSRSELKGGSWSAGKPSYQTGHFYFVKAMIWRTQTDGVTRKTYETPVFSTLVYTEIGDPYLIIGPENADFGDFFEEYYLSSSSVEPKFGEWVSDPEELPGYRPGWYYWVRHLIHLAGDNDGDGEPDYIYTDPVMAPTLASVGAVLTLDCPWATQAMADNILARIKGYSYQPFTAREALLDPAAELGDGITVGGVQSVIAAVTISYDTMVTSEVSAPSDQEIDHEFPYQQLSNRELQREISKKAWATLSVAREEIAMEVGRATRAEEVLLGKLSLTADRFQVEISRVEGDIQQAASSITMLEDEINLTVKVGNVTSTLNMEEDLVSIKAQRFEVTSDNFNIDGAAGLISSKTYYNENSGQMPYILEIDAGALNFFKSEAKTPNGVIRSASVASKTDDISQAAYSVLEIQAGLYGIIFTHGNTYYYAFNCNEFNPNDRPERHYFYKDVVMTNDLRVLENCWAQGNLSCSGTKNRVVKTPDYGEVCLTAMESAYPVFSDLGSGEIGEDGAAYIFLDPDFSETVELSHNYQVNLTQTSPGQIQWTEKRDGYFIVHGEAGTAFDWIIYARQRDYAEYRMEPMNITTQRPSLREDQFDNMIDAYPGEREENTLYLQMEAYLDEYEKEVNPER